MRNVDRTPCGHMEEMISYVRFVHGPEVQLPEINSGTTITCGQLIKGYGDRETRLKVSYLAGEEGDVSDIF